MDTNYQLQLERAHIFKDACSMYQRGYVELQLRVCMGLHRDNPENPNQFMCQNVAYDKNFTATMRHWRGCKLKQKPVIRTRYSKDALLMQASQPSVEACLDNLYDLISYFNLDDGFPVRVPRFDQNDALTLALLTFFDAASIPYDVIPTLEFKDPTTTTTTTAATASPTTAAAPTTTTAAQHP